MIEPDEKQATLSGEEQPRQEEMPFAVVQGEPVTTIPQDLYIPPDALEYFSKPLKGRWICCSI